jgi:hypothetical protein
MGQDQSESIGTIYPKGIYRCALAKKNLNPFGLRSIFGGGGGNCA